MIKIENKKIVNWKNAIQKMKFSINSYEKSNICDCHQPNCLCKNDLQIIKKLINAGPEHVRFMEMFIVTCSITAPGYWWQEFDSYQILRNGHNRTQRVHEKEFSLDDFSYENLVGEGIIPDHIEQNPYDALCNLINTLNFCRETYIDTKDKKWWWQMIQLLPSSYNQQSEVLLNYWILRVIYHSRKNHMLDEWRDFCKWIETLPYSKLITITGDIG